MYVRQLLGSWPVSGDIFVWYTFSHSNRENTAAPFPSSGNYFSGGCETVGEFFAVMGFGCSALLPLVEW